MAESSGTSLMQVTVNFEGARTVLHLPRDMKVGRAIQKAADHFKQDPSGLTFLYHGNVITDDMTVGIALAQAHNVTVIHLIRVSSKKPTTATIHATPDGKPREVVYGFCSECDSLVPTREIFLCPSCGEGGMFLRSSSVHINHFAREVNPALLRGSCGVCDKDNIQASVQFMCKSCDEEKQTRVGPLRQIRSNFHNIKCMKCGLRKEMVFRYACSSSHCMCINCFSNMCKQQLNSKKFRNFENMGFSINCPGPGPDCKIVPVPDPHHFKIVDDPQFYGKFKDMSIQEFEPSGENIMCSCKTMIDIQQSKNSYSAEVTEPLGDLPSISGLKWYHKLFGTKPPPPPPRIRRKTSCGNCQLTYCVACKQVWHEGDCREISKEVIEEEQAYPIDPVLAKESCWPEE